MERENYPVGEEPALFLSQRGKRLSTRAVDFIIRHIGEEAALEEPLWRSRSPRTLFAHALRHTCMTNLVRAGYDLVLVAEIAGHKRLETTRRYSGFAAPPNREQLDRHFYLDERDRRLIEEKRRESNRLGFGFQLGTVRFLGTFLADPTDVPKAMVTHVARQLEVADPGVLGEYARRPNTFRAHAQEIRREYGYKDYSDPVERLGLLRFLYSRAWLRADGPTVLFDLATARLAERKVLLLGVSTLAREVAQIRDRVSQRLWAAIARAPDPVQRERLLGLLAVREGSRL